MTYKQSEDITRRHGQRTQFFNEIPAMTTYRAGMETLENFGLSGSITMGIIYRHIRDCSQLSRAMICFIFLQLPVFPFRLAQSTSSTARNIYIVSFSGDSITHANTRSW
jgi:hypothetical protein